MCPDLLNSFLLFVHDISDIIDYVKIKPSIKFDDGYGHPSSGLLLIYFKLKKGDKDPDQMIIYNCWFRRYCDYKKRSKYYTPRFGFSDPYEYVIISNFISNSLNRYPNYVDVHIYTFENNRITDFAAEKKHTLEKMQILVSDREYKSLRFTDQYYYPTLKDWIKENNITNRKWRSKLVDYFQKCDNAYNRVIIGKIRSGTSLTKKDVEAYNGFKEAFKELIKIRTLLNPSNKLITENESN